MVRPDSSTSSIRRLCRNTPSGGLVGAAPLGVASVYGHSPFGAASVARRGKPAWGPSHMLVFPYTPPSERIELEIKCAHIVPWLICSLKALERVKDQQEFCGICASERCAILSALFLVLAAPANSSCLIIGLFCPLCHLLVQLLHIHHHPCPKHHRRYKAPTQE